MKRTFTIALAFVVVMLVVGVILVGTGGASLTRINRIAADTNPYTHDDQPDFAVDVVTLWVDGSDANWRKQLQAYLVTEREDHPDVDIYHSDKREPEVADRGSKDELYYSAHTVVKFMPWVRRYYLVTMRPHKPAWWPASGKLGNISFVLVHHDQIFDGDVKLPTFNSNAIQRHISRIPGLAEHFLLFDDDCYVGQHMHKSNFFTKQGAPRLRMEQFFDWPSRHEQQPNWARMLQNTARMITSVIGEEKPVLMPVHVPVAMRKSIWDGIVFHGLGKEASRKFKRFRSNVDFTVQYVIAGILYGTGMAKPMSEDIETAYIREYAPIMHPTPHLFCINNKLNEAHESFLESLLS